MEKSQKYLGVDYGSKRVGLAFSSERGDFALPHGVLQNDETLLERIKNICEDLQIRSVVLGDPGENDFRKDVLVFKSKLELAGFDVFLEKEFMTSFHTDLFNKKKPVARKIKQEMGDKKDESAAALILQRFLDKLKSRE